MEGASSADHCLDIVSDVSCFRGTAIRNARNAPNLAIVEEEKFLTANSFHGKTLLLPRPVVEATGVVRTIDAGAVRHYPPVSNFYR